MRRSSLLNKCVAVALVLAVHTGCNESAEKEAGSDATDTIATTIGPATADNTDVTNPNDTIVKPEPQKKGTAIEHQSEDDGKLDSIKKAKRKDKVSVNRQINHGSENDQLLDSIKKAKSKGKK